MKGHQQMIFPRSASSNILSTLVPGTLSPALSVTHTIEEKTPDELAHQKIKFRMQKSKLPRPVIQHKEPTSYPVMKSIAAPGSIRMSKISTDGLSMRFNKTPQTILSYRTTPLTFETLPESLSSQDTGEGSQHYASTKSSRRIDSPVRQRFSGPLDLQQKNSKPSIPYRMDLAIGHLVYSSNHIYADGKGNFVLNDSEQPPSSNINNTVHL